MDGGYNILVVERPVAGAPNMCDALDGGPYRTEVVMDPDTVLPRLELGTYHLVITDVQLIETTGLALLESLRINHPRLPVILVTDEAKVETAIEALRLGATNFVTWPCPTDELRDVVRKSLRPWAINSGQRDVIPRMRKTLSMKLVSSTEVIDPVFAHVYEDALSLGFPDATLRLNVYLALNEALANAIRHGNKSDPSKTVEVSVEMTSERLDIRVTDQGEGFDPGALPDPTVIENLLKASGRGVFLMRCYMDEVEYLDGGRTLRLAKMASEEGLREEALESPPVSG